MLIIKSGIKKLRNRLFMRYDKCKKKIEEKLLMKLFKRSKKDWMKILMSLIEGNNKVIIWMGKKRWQIKKISKPKTEI